MAKFLNESGGMLVLADQHNIPAGSEVEIDAEGQKNLAVSRWIKEGKLVEKKSGKSSSAKSGSEQTTQPGAFTVADKGSGWFVVKQGDQEVTKSLRADDVAGFDEKSDEDKAAFVAANASES